MTTKEMIEVMQAYDDGEEIEFHERSIRAWYATQCHLWDWSNYDYRIKPKPKYVPYDSVTEVERDKWFKAKASGRIYRIKAIDASDNTMRLTRDWCSLKELFEFFTYEDGTPCGKKAEA